MFRAGEDHACGAGGRGRGCDKRQQGVKPVDYAEEIDIHYFVEVGGVFLGAAGADACIEDKEVDFLCVDFMLAKLCARHVI